MKGARTPSCYCYVGIISCYGCQICVCFVNLDIHDDFVVLNMAVVCNVHSIVRLLECHSKADGKMRQRAICAQMERFDNLIENSALSVGWNHIGRLLTSRLKIGARCFF